MTNWITRFSPAKINLALHVVGQRADGYHLLQSLVVFAGTGDQLAARPGNMDNLKLDGPFASGLHGSGQNLVLDAIAAFREKFPEHLPAGVEVKLTKNLPVASGIGGGSSNAAAMLRILERLARLPVERSELDVLAVQLGADVPACLLQKPQIMAGIGEKLRLADALPEAHLVLVNPKKHIRTADVFSRLENRNNTSMPAFPQSLPKLSVLVDWLKTTRNDLVAPAQELVPQITQLTCFLESQSDCLFARMSGSGATVFGLFDNEQQATLVAKAAQRRWPQYWVVSAPMLK